MDLMSIYNRSPVFMQNIMCSAVGLQVKERKYGRRQKKYLAEYMERKDWPYEKLIEYRDARLRKMVEHCYTHVPYYRGLFDSLGIDYRSITTLEDLAVLPILDKRTITEHKSEFLADDLNKRELMAMHTSGSTGSAFQFYYTKSAYAQQWAEDERYTKSIGVDLKAWKAYFGGRSIVPKGKNKTPFYRVNYPMKEILFSAWHMSPANFPSYVEGMNKYRPMMWHGYPSSIEALAQFLLDSGQRLSFVPNIILLASEAVTEAAVGKITRAFGVKPIQGYAQTEEVATFREYPDGMYIVEDLSAVELVPEPGGLYRVIGTTLTNYAMPFLRYDTKDLVEYETTPEGRKIKRIDGRAEDNIKLRGGGVIRRLDFLFKDQVNIVEACIIQRNLDVVEIQVVRGSNYSMADEKTLRHDAEDYFSGRIAFDIKYVGSIPKSSNGKRKFILSEV